MNSRSYKTKKNKNHTAANGISEKSGIGSVFQFVDNRPEAIAQREILEMGDNRLKMKQLRSVQGVVFSKDSRQANQLKATTENHFANQQPVLKKRNNTGLSDDLKSGIEYLSGFDMSDTKVHYNSDKPAQLNAHAYAQGTDIHLASGQEKQLPHEAWHVVQQKQGRVQPTLQRKSGVNINDDVGLEKEADVMGAMAKTVQLNSTESLQSSQNGSSQSKEFTYKENEIKIHPKLNAPIQFMSVIKTKDDDTEICEFTMYEEHPNQDGNYKDDGYSYTFIEEKGLRVYYERVPKLRLLSAKSSVSPKFSDKLKRIDSRESAAGSRKGDISTADSKNPSFESDNGGADFVMEVGELINGLLKETFSAKQHFCELILNESTQGEFINRIWSKIFTNLEQFRMFLFTEDSSAKAISFKAGFENNAQVIIAEKMKVLDEEMDKDEWVGNDGEKTTAWDKIEESEKDSVADIVPDITKIVEQIIKSTYIDICMSSIKSFTPKTKGDQEVEKLLPILKRGGKDTDEELANLEVNLGELGYVRGEVDGLCYYVLESDGLPELARSLIELILGEVETKKEVYPKLENINTDIKGLLKYYNLTAAKGHKLTPEIISRIVSKVSAEGFLDNNDTNIEGAYSTFQTIMHGMRKKAIFVFSDYDVTDGLSGTTFGENEDVQRRVPKIYINIAKVSQKLGLEGKTGKFKDDNLKLISGTIIHELSHAFGFDPEADEYKSAYSGISTPGGHASVEEQYAKGKEKRWFVDPDFIAALWLKMILKKQEIVKPY